MRRMASLEEWLEVGAARAAARAVAMAAAAAAATAAATVAATEEVTAEGERAVVKWAALLGLRGCRG